MAKDVVDNTEKGADGLTSYERAVRILNIYFQGERITVEKIRTATREVVEKLLPESKIDIEVLTKDLIERWDEFIASYVVKVGDHYFTGGAYSMRQSDAARFRNKGDAQKFSDEITRSRVVLLVKKEMDDG